MGGPSRRLLLTGAGAALVAAALGIWSALAAEGFATSELAVVTANGRFAFTVEIAVTEAQRAQGLQGRRTLPPSGGMLFDFRETQPVAMWMKDTPISLDMLFIAANGRVVNIAERTVPFSLATIPSARPVRAVLELNAGTAERLGVRPGDQIIHPIFSGSREGSGK